MHQSLRNHRITMLAAAVIFSIIIAGGLFALSKVETTQAQTSGPTISLNNPVSFPVDI